MILKHGDCLSYELPKNWTAEEDDDTLLIYNPDGNGSVTVSFFNILDSSVFLDEYVSIFAKEFIRFLYKGIIIKHNKTEPTYTKTSLFLCEKRRFFMARTEKGVVATI